MKFKGKIEHQSFINLSNDERDFFLINNKIFIETLRPTIYNVKPEDLIHHNPYEVSKIFSKPLITKKGSFSINPELLEEVESLIVKQCKKTFDELLEKRLVMKEQFYEYPEERIKELEIYVRTTHADSLSNKFYFKVSRLDFRNFEQHIDTIKYFSKYDSKFIYDYLIDNDNKSELISSKHHSFIYNSICLELINEVKEFRNLKTTNELSIPKKIALMHVLGIFKNEIGISLSTPKKIKLLSYILDIKLDDNKKTYLRKQLTSLNPSSEMDPKGMASLHLHNILTEVLNK